MNDLNKKILVIEDNKDLSTLLSDALKEGGFEVVNAFDGNEGLKMALEDHPDFILLDIILPKMDGLIMLKKLRQDERGKNVPVMILTNLSDTDKISSAMQDEVYDFLVKDNWKLQDVVKKIKNRLGV